MKNSLKTRLSCAALLLIGLLASALPAFAGGNSALLVLGDSFAYGFTTKQDAQALGPTYGDMGYVKPFADYLATQNGGMRPALTNLAIPGESSNSFYTGMSAVPYPDAYPYTSALSEAPARFPLLNLNYAPSDAPNYPTTPQRDAALAAISAAHAAGQSVDNIVLQIGGNDFLGVLFQPAFVALPKAQQESLLLSQFGKFQVNYADIVGSLEAAAPEATLFSVGYPNSFRQTPGVGPIAEFLITNANAVIADVSSSMGAKYIDLYTPFKGHELELTHEGDGDLNPHPNAAGYALIADQLQIAASAPEPASLVLLLLVAPVAAVASRRVPRSAGFAGAGGGGEAA